MANLKNCTDMFHKEVDEREFLITKIAAKHGIAPKLVSWERLPDFQVYFICYEALPHRIFRSYIPDTSANKILFTRKEYEKRFRITSIRYPETLSRKENFSLYKNQVYEKIEQLHSLGIVHGDLHEENIVVNDNEVKLIDFGLSKFTNDFSDDIQDLRILFG